MHKAELHRLKLIKPTPIKLFLDNMVAAKNTTYIQQKLVLEKKKNVSLLRFLNQLAKMLRQAHKQFLNYSH